MLRLIFTALLLALFGKTYGQNTLTISTSSNGQSVSPCDCKSRAPLEIRADFEFPDGIGDNQMIALHVRLKDGFPLYTAKWTRRSWEAAFPENKGSIVLLSTSDFSAKDKTKGHERLVKDGQWQMTPKALCTSGKTSEYELDVTLNGYVVIGKNASYNEDGSQAVVSNRYGDSVKLVESDVPIVIRIDPKFKRMNKIMGWD